MHTARTAKALGCLCTMILVAAALRDAIAIVTPDEVVGVWLFDEGAGDTTADVAGNGHDGELQRSPRWVDGVFGAALRFSGGGETVRIPDMAVNFPSEEVTIVAWARTTGQENQNLFSLVPINLGRVTVHMPWDDTNLIWLFGTPFAGFAKNIEHTFDIWTHYAFVNSVADRMMLVYVNGEEFVGPATARAFVGRSGDLHIGGRPDYSYTGDIDEFAIFNRVLSVDAVNAIMNDGLTATVLSYLSLPVTAITVPTPSAVLPAGTTAADLRVITYNNLPPGHWHWKLNGSFPSSGPAGGTAVLEGDAATMTGLTNGETYTVWVALVDGAGDLIERSTTAAVTFSVEQPVPTNRYEYTLPAGLSLFSPVYRAILLNDGVQTIDTRPSGILMARHMVQLGATVVIRLVDGNFNTVIGRDGSLLFGADFAMGADRGYVVNMLASTSFTMDGIPYGVPIEAAPGLPRADVTALWAFVVAGDLIQAPTLPPGTRVPVVNERTAIAFDTPLHADRRFIDAFVDENHDDVIAENDLLTNSSQNV